VWNGGPPKAALQTQGNSRERKMRSDQRCLRERLVWALRRAIENTNECTSIALPDVGVEWVGAGLDYFVVEHSGFFEDGVRSFAWIVFHADGQILKTLVEFLRLVLTLGKQSEPTRVDVAINEVGILRAAVERNGHRHARSNGHSGYVLLRDAGDDFCMADPCRGDGPRGDVSATKKESCVGDSEKQQSKNEEDPA
jgi:hypothetical protein